MNLFSYIIVAFTQKIQSQFLSHLKLANSLLFPYAPHISSVVSLYGALSLFCTARFLCGLPVRCTFSFLHRTHSPQPSCTVHFHLFAPHTFSATFLCGALSPFRTVHILRNLPVRCSFTFSHRTHLPQPSCAVHFHFFAPHTFSAAFLCGALSPFRTVHFLCGLPVRYTFLHRTHSLRPSCAVLIHLFAPHTFSVAFLYGARSPFCTAHNFRSFPVRCTFPFLHRTLPLWTSCAVHFHLFAPHTSSAAFLCGDIFTFYTATFLSLPSRCSLPPHNSDSIHRTAGTRWYIMECAVFGRAR